MLMEYVHNMMEKNIIQNSFQEQYYLNPRDMMLKMCNHQGLVESNNYLKTSKYQVSLKSIENYLYKATIEVQYFK